MRKFFSALRADRSALRASVNTESASGHRLRRCATILGRTTLSMPLPPLTCCGSNFCHTCIQRELACSRACPICRKGNIGVFPNETLKRSLRQLQVYCTHRRAGTIVSSSNHICRQNACLIFREPRMITCCRSNLYSARTSSQ